MKKIVFEERYRPITDREIKRRRDFDLLTLRYTKRKSALRKYYRMGLILACVMIPGLGVFAYFNADKLARQLENVESLSTTASQPKLLQPIQPDIPQVEKPKLQYDISKLIERKITMPTKTRVTQLNDEILEAAPLQGHNHLFTYFEKEIHYPKDALDQNISGPVKAILWINAQGQPEDVQILQGLYPSLDEEAIRVIAKMPAWNPATINGQPYRSRIVLTVQFVIKNTPSTFSSEDNL